MRATLTLLLAAACVAFIADEALAECARGTWGITKAGPEVRMHVVETQVVSVKGKSNVTETIQFTPIPDCVTVGVAAKFCEADRLRFTEDYEVIALLEYTKTFATKGLLSSTVYCSPRIVKLATH